MSVRWIRMWSLTTAWLGVACGGSQVAPASAHVGEAPAASTRASDEPAPSPTSPDAAPTASPEPTGPSPSAPSATAAGDATTSERSPSTAPSNGSSSGQGRLSSPQHHPLSMREVGPTVAGSLPIEAIRKVIRKNYGRLRLCYETGLKTNPKLEGIVNTSFRIDATGAIKDVREKGSTLRDPAVVACVVRGFDGLSFPKPEGGDVSVTFPLSFTPGD